MPFRQRFITESSASRNSLCVAARNAEQAAANLATLPKSSTSVTLQSRSIGRDANKSGSSASALATTFCIFVDGRAARRGRGRRYRSLLNKQQASIRDERRRGVEPAGVAFKLGCSRRNEQPSPSLKTEATRLRTSEPEPTVLCTPLHGRRQRGPGGAPRWMVITPRVIEASMRRERAPWGGGVIISQHAPWGGGG